MTRIKRSSGRRIGSMVVTVVLAASGAFAGTAVANHNANDVGTSNFFHDEIGWLIDQGIANGFPDGSFKPTDPIKRQQLALWLGNYNDSLEVVQFTQTLANTTVGASTVTCPAGKRAVAGGGATDVSDAVLTDSRPSVSGTSWVARFVRNNEGFFTGSDHATVYALCVPLPVAAG